jgi:hypothetical protein
MQLNNSVQGYGRPQQLISDLNSDLNIVQANLDPNSREFQNTQQRKSDLVDLFSQNSPLAFLASQPPVKDTGSKQERLVALSNLQASLAPGSSAYQQIEKVKASLLATPDAPGPEYGTPQQLIAELNLMQANLNPNSAEYQRLETRKQALLGKTPVSVNSNNSVFGLLVSMMSMLVQSMLTMNGSKA